MKKRTNVLIDDALLKRARTVLGAATNTEAITKALRSALGNAEIERTLEDLLREGRGKFVDVSRQVACLSSWTRTSRTDPSRSRS
jgi:Arc/MetJ family transcription regulator